MAVRPKVAVKVVDKGWEEILRAVKFGDSQLEVGVLGEKAARNSEAISNVDLAVIHEFGSPAANIPERSFIRAAFKKHLPEYQKLIRRIAEAVVQGKRPDLPRLFNLLGAKAAADIKNGITQGAGIPPPLQPETVARKGSSRPLVDTGQLLNAITWAFKRGKGSS